jgi:threonine aldolase
MIEDLNNKLLSIMNSNKTNLVIFTFSASRELNKTFLSKIFNDSILNNKESVKIMKMNEITEINITKTLQKIKKDNGIRINQQRIDEIVKN